MARTHSKQTRRNLEKDHQRGWYINPRCYEILAGVSGKVKGVLKTYRRHKPRLYGRFMQSPKIFQSFVDAIEARLKETGFIPTQEIIALGSKSFDGYKEEKLKDIIKRIIGRMHSSNKELFGKLEASSPEIYERLAQTPRALVTFDRALRTLYGENKERFKSLQENPSELENIAKRALSKAKKRQKRNR